MESQKPVPARRRWTAAEEKQFQDMLDAGKAAKEIFRSVPFRQSMFFCGVSTNGGHDLDAMTAAYPKRNI
jgi:hypothetical protein